MDVGSLFLRSFMCALSFIFLWIFGLLPILLATPLVASLVCLYRAFADVKVASRKEDKEVSHLLAQTTAENNGLSKLVDCLRGENFDLHKAVDIARDEKFELVEQLNNLTLEIAKNAFELQDKKREVEEMKLTVDDQKDQIDQLAAAYKELKMARGGKLELATKVASLNAANKKLLLELAEKTNELDLRSKVEIDQRAQLEKLQDEMDDLKRASERNGKDEQLDILMFVNAGMESELKEKKSEMAEMTKTLQEQETKVKDLEQYNEDLLSDNSNLVNRLDCMEDIVSQFKKELRDARSQIERQQEDEQHEQRHQEMTETLLEQKTRIEQLERNNDQLNEENLNLIKKVGCFEVMFPCVQEQLKEANCYIKRQREETEQEQRQQMAQVEKIGKLENKICNLSMDVAASRDEVACLTEVRKALIQELANVRQQLKKAVEANADKAEQIAKLEETAERWNAIWTLAELKPVNEATSLMRTIENAKNELGEEKADHEAEEQKVDAKEDLNKMAQAAETDHEKEEVEQEDDFVVV